MMQTKPTHPSLIEDMQRRLRSARDKRNHMIAEGADPRVIPAKHTRTMVWLAQRLGHKTVGADYSNAASRRAVAEFYLDGRYPDLVKPLSEAIDREIDRVGTSRLSDIEFADIVLVANNLARV